MHGPLVSILMPAYNARPYVAAAVESALNQTYPNVEVVVVDDGSTDGTREALQAFEDHARVTVIDQANAGAAAARNRAYVESRGEYVKFFDADDLLSTEHVALQVGRLEDDPTCVAMAEWDRFYEDPDAAEFAARPSWRDADPVAWVVGDWVGARPMTQPGMFLIPRAIAERAGPWDERLSLTDDFDYFARVILASGGVRFTPGARLYYRSGLSSALSGRKGEGAVRSHLLALELGTNRLLQEEDSARTRRAAANMLQGFVYTYYPNHPDLLAQARQRVAALGGSDLAPEGPPGFQKLCPFVGWRLARRVQLFTERRGWNRAALRKATSI